MDVSTAFILEYGSIYSLCRYPLPLHINMRYIFNMEVCNSFTRQNVGIYYFKHLESDFFSSSGIMENYFKNLYQPNYSTGWIFMRSTVSLNSRFWYSQNSCNTSVKSPCLHNYFSISDGEERWIHISLKDICALWNGNIRVQNLNSKSRDHIHYATSILWFWN